jgi:23S rRNA (adenine2503-C2)-methyltransferase
MKVIEIAGRPDLAQVFVLQMRQGPESRVECVGAIDPSLPRSQKVVLVVSSQYGCPVRCCMCDAGSWYEGNLTADEILQQVEHLVASWAPQQASSCPKFKVQFARMGEPALNDAVLDAIERLPTIIASPGLTPCVATTAPRSRLGWFERLLAIRTRMYGPDKFQLQFSVQSTDESVRDRMIPISKFSLAEIGSFAQRFVRPGDRKVTLNFALARGVPVCASALARVVSPQSCVVKITPLNNTQASRRSGLSTAFEQATEQEPLRIAREFEAYGFRCILSVGDPEESAIGSSCGQLAKLVRRAQTPDPTAGCEIDGSQ